MGLTSSIKRLTDLLPSVRVVFITGVVYYAAINWPLSDEQKKDNFNLYRHSSGILV